MTRLLSHFWTADDPPELRRVQLEDWLEDLGEFSYEGVETACRIWRREQNRRPTPADIRKLCQPVISEPRIPYFPPSAESLDQVAERRRAIAERWADVREALKAD